MHLQKIAAAAKAHQKKKKGIRGTERGSLGGDVYLLGLTTFVLKP